MDILTLSHVQKHFGSKQILKDVSFRVPDHTIFGFVGQNGAGKTTAMKLILGLLPTDGGTILVNGKPVSFGKSETGCMIGYLPDIPEFYPYMTPFEYLCFCGEVTGMKKTEYKNRAEELLHLVGLSHYASSKETQRIKGFSRGMKQRLGLAQALFHRPKLLICDEPTSALDPAGRREILDLLLAAKSQTTILFSTHILSDVEQICDEIAFLHNGTIVLQGTLETVKTIHPTAEYLLETESSNDIQILLSAFPSLKQAGSAQLLFTASSQTVSINHLLSFLASQNIPIIRLEKREATLEALFMEVIGK